MLSRCMFIIVSLSILISCAPSQEQIRYMHQQRQNYIASNGMLTNEQKAAILSGKVIKGMTPNEVGVSVFCDPCTFATYQVFERNGMEIYVPSSNQSRQNTFEDVTRYVSEGGTLLCIIYDGASERYRILFKDGKVEDAIRFKSRFQRGDNWP
jgi:hypothetical protein